MNAAMESLQLTETSSCLSPGVHKLITQYTESKERDERAFNQHRFLDVAYICSQLPAPIEDNMFTGDPTDYFCDCVKVLAPMMHSVEDYMDTLTQDGLHGRFEKFLTWTGQSNVLLDSWRSLYDTDRVSEMLVFLVTTAILERSLGDVYLTRGPVPCPSMLKDLLVTKELKDIVGKEVIQILRVLIGPPTSLNLRNVTWHGFPFPGEIPRRCLWFIILLVPSIGQILHDQGITTIAHREPVKLPYMVNISNTSMLESNPNTLIEPLAQSTFVSWDTKPFWSSVVTLLHNHRYTHVCALLLCYLENGMRRVFAAANNCHHRVLTAEATTLYTTFDEILDPTLPDGSSNQLLKTLGTQNLEILMDMLMYQDGPRLRDHLSHGEIDWEPSGVSAHIAHNLFIVTLFLSTKFMPAEYHSKVPGLDKIKDDICNYKVQFHRIAVIQYLVEENVTTACNIDGLISILPDLSPRQPEVHYPLSGAYVEVEAKTNDLLKLVEQTWTTFKLNSTIHDSLTYRTLDKFSKTVKEISTRNISTLYREKQTGTPDTGQADREGELLTILHHIANECRAVLSNVVTCVTCRQKQLENKELRSRQRENFKKFFSYFQCYVTVSCLCGFLVQWQLHHLDAHNNCTQHSVKQRIKYWKSLLQFCENLRTFSHQDKNKWSEGQDLIAKFLRSICGNFTMVFTN